MFNHSSGQIFASLAVARFFASLPQTHMCPSGGFFVEQFESFHTDPGFRQ